MSLRLNCAFVVRSVTLGFATKKLKQLREGSQTERVWKYRLWLAEHCASQPTSQRKKALIQQLLFTFVVERQTRCRSFVSFLHPVISALDHLPLKKTTLLLRVCLLVLCLYTYVWRFVLDCLCMSVYKCICISFENQSLVRSSHLSRSHQKPRTRVFSTTKKSCKILFNTQTKHIRRLYIFVEQRVLARISWKPFFRQARIFYSLHP